MQSTMDRTAHHAAGQRALALGRSADPAALPEHDLYVEYWGMEDNLDYQIGMLEKKLYQQVGKRLVSLHPADKDRLDEALGAKLVRLAAPPPSASAASQQPPPA